MLFRKRNTGLPDKEKPAMGDMNEESVSWYRSGGSFYEENGEGNGESPLTELNKKELRRVAANATLAALLVGSVFIIVFFLFIMFCVNVWFK